jgi:hypothetical protein
VKWVIRRDPQCKREICNSATLKPGFAPLPLCKRDSQNCHRQIESHRYYAFFDHTALPLLLPLATRRRHCSSSHSPPDRRATPVPPSSVRHPCSLLATVAKGAPATALLLLLLPLCAVTGVRRRGPVPPQASLASPRVRAVGSSTAGGGRRRVLVIWERQRGEGEERKEKVEGIIVIVRIVAACLPLRMTFFEAKLHNNK